MVHSFKMIFKLWSFLLSVAVLLVVAAPSLRGEDSVEQSPAADQKIALDPSDIDSDWLVGKNDPAPAFANVPLLWEVKMFSISQSSLPPGASGQGWAVSTNLVVSDSSSSFSKIAASKITTSINKVGGINGRTDAVHPFAPLCLFPSDSFKWGHLERFRAARILDGRMTATVQLPLTLLFKVYFTNLDSETRYIPNDIEVPVCLDGKIWTVAKLSNAIAGKKTKISADGRSYVLNFTAEILPEDVVPFLSTLATSKVSPEFSVSLASRLEDAESIAEFGYSLSGALKTIKGATSELSVTYPDGRRYCWRVAKNLKVADCFAHLNLVMDRYAGMSFCRDDNGYVVSINGWDTGYWDLWWNMTRDGSKVPYSNWLSAKLDADVAFFMCGEPPEIKQSRRRHLAKNVSLPAMDFLLGKLFWDDGDYAQATNFFTKAADTGLPQGFSWLGKCISEQKISNEESAESSSNRATEYFAKAASAGYAPGEAWYGRALLKGSGVNKPNRATATEFLKRSSAQGFPEGKALYALCLLRGVGCDADAVSAMRLLAEAADDGSTTAELGLAIKLIEDKSAEGLDWLTAAAQSCNAKAQARLAVFLKNGELGTQPDSAASIRWNKLAASQGDSSALVALGEAYTSGFGVKSDIQRAAGYFKAAAEADNRDGQTWYALCLLDGNGVKRDPVQAVTWLRKASDKGARNAQYILGICLFAGLEGIEKDEAEAFRCFCASANAQVLARVFEGYCHFSGRGTKKDDKLAFTAFEKASSAGSSVGKIWLAYCYANGIGVTKDVAKARDIAQALSDSGNSAGAAFLRSLD